MGGLLGGSMASTKDFWCVGEVRGGRKGGEVGGDHPPGPQRGLDSKPVKCLL